MYSSQGHFAGMIVIGHEHVGMHVTGKRWRFVIGWSDARTITQGKSRRLADGSSEADTELRTSQKVTVKTGCKRTIKSLWLGAALNSECRHSDASSENRDSNV